jgi:hypothetical protein
MRNKNSDKLIRFRSIRPEIKITPSQQNEARKRQVSQRFVPHLIISPLVLLGRA